MGGGGFFSFLLGPLTNFKDNSLQLHSRNKFRTKFVLTFFNVNTLLTFTFMDDEQSIESTF